MTRDQPPLVTVIPCMAYQTVLGLYEGGHTPAQGSKTIHPKIAMLQVNCENTTINVCVFIRLSLCLVGMGFVHCSIHCSIIYYTYIILLIQMHGFM